MLSPETLDVLSTEELIEKTSYEDKYLIQTFLGRMEELVDRYMSIRRGELGKPEIKYSLESVTFSSTYITVKYSHNGGCRCSSNCGYDYDDYEIMLTDLFLSEDGIKKIFAEEKAVELQKVAKWLKEKADLEEKARQKKENDEKVLLEQLKKKYEEKQ
jgi:hypothetical protein